MEKSIWSLLFFSIIILHWSSIKAYSVYYNFNTRLRVRRISNRKNIVSRWESSRTLFLSLYDAKSSTKKFYEGRKHIVSKWESSRTLFLSFYDAKPSTKKFYEGRKHIVSKWESSRTLFLSFYDAKPSTKKFYEGQKHIVSKWESSRTLFLSFFLWCKTIHEEILWGPKTYRK